MTKLEAYKYLNDELYCGDDLVISEVQRREYRRAIAESMDNGMSLQEVCEKTSRSLTFIRNVCVEFGVTSIRQHRSMKNVVKIVSLLIDNPRHTFTKIGKRCKVSGEYVRQVHWEMITCGMIT